jgi:hypothetical protein
MQGSMTVFVNGKPAVRMGDKTKHCGGLGQMVEGSQNVDVGGPPGTGSSGGAGGGGGGGGSPGGGGGGSSSSSSSSASRSSSSSSGGSGGPGGGGGSSGGGQGAQSAKSSSSSSSSSSRSSAAGNSPASSAQDPKKKEDDPNVYVVAADLKTPGGQPLGFEQVVLVKKGSDQPIAGPETTDDKGHIAFVVDEPGDYEIRVVADDKTHPKDHIDEKDVTFELHCQFLDDGVPVSGETVQITGPGTNLAVALDGTGPIALHVGAGEYELSIRKQRFKANAVRSADLAGHHEFQLENELDRTADFERARANRYSPANRGQA